MRKLIVFAFLFGCFSFSAFSQHSDTAKKQMERYEKEMKEKEEKYIADFVKTLDENDFVKEIVSQKLLSYSDEKKKILAYEIESFKKQELVEELNIRHFSDLKPIASENTLEKINLLITGKYEEHKKKEKKKRKKKKN